MTVHVQKMENDPNLTELIQEKITFGQNLVDSLQTYNCIDGIQKLGRKINQELNFLRKVIEQRPTFINITNIMMKYFLHDFFAGS